MKYYAVTEDPNELLHYGRLGMKWGQHIFVGPKSLAYKRAEGKLKRSSSKSSSITKAKSSGRSVVGRARSALKKSMAQHDINRQKKQQEKYNNAVKKAQQRIAITEKMSNLDNLRSYERRGEHLYKMDQFAAKTAAKRERIAEKMDRKYARNERKMEKYTQEAREGRLRYGKLSNEQIDRIRDRLALENTARNLGGREKASYRRRLKEAIQEGTLQGITQGTAAGIREVAVAKVQNRLRNKAALEKKNRNEAKRQKEATRIKNKRTRKEIREDLKQEAYEAQVESGAGLRERSRILHPFTNNNAGKMLQQAEQRKKLNSQVAEYKMLYDSKDKLTKLGEKVQKAEDTKQRLEAEKALRKKLYETDAYENSETGKRLQNIEDEARARKFGVDQYYEEQKFIADESRNSRRSARQDAENEAREERKLLKQGEREYKYGYKSDGNNKGNKNGDQSGGSAGEYYRRTQVDHETIQQTKEKEARDKKFMDAERERLADYQERQDAEIKEWQKQIDQQIKDNERAFENAQERVRSRTAVAKQSSSKPLTSHYADSKDNTFNNSFPNYEEDKRVENARRNTSVRRRNRNKK